MAKSRYLAGKKIIPQPITKGIKVTDLIDNYFQAYNAARLKRGGSVICRKNA